MRPALLNPLFAPVTSLAGVGPKQDKLFRYLLGRERDAAAGRSAAASAGERDRPPRAAENPRCRAGDRGHAGGHGRPASADAVAQRARAASGLCQRRHRRRRADLFPRPARLCRKAAAGRRQALRLRHRADVSTARCRSCIPTAWWTKRVLQSCPASIPSIRSPRGWRSARCGARWRRRCRSCRRCRNGSARK